MLPSAKSFKTHMEMWRMFGWWDLDGVVPRPMWYRVYFIIMTIIFFVLFPLGMFIQLFRIDNIDDLVQTLMYFLTALCALKLWLVTVYHKPKILHLFDLMNRLDTYIGDDIEHQETITKGVKRATLYNKFVLYLYLVVCWILWLNTFMKTERALMWLSWTPFDYQANQIVYQGVLFYQYMGTSLTATVHASFDTFAAGMYSVVESHLNVLGQRLQNLGKNRREDQKVNTPRYLEWQKSCEKELTECVLIHQLCVEFCDCTNDLLSLINMVQFGISGINICATAYQLSVLDMAGMTVEQVTIALIAMIALFYCFCIQIFVPCLSAGQVTANTERLPYFMFGCNWLEQRRQFQSSMSIFVERAKQSIIPTAGGLFEIGLPRFVAIMRAAYSMFACMKNLSAK